MERIKAFFGDLFDKYCEFGIVGKALTWFTLCLLFILFIDLVAMPLYTRHGNEYELPDVTEKNVNEAVEILENSGFIPIIQDSVYDSYYTPGTVVRQNPMPYSTVKSGRRVYLVVSKGEKPIYMPKLVSETLTNARLKLQELGLSVGNINYDYSSTYPYRGVVIWQSVPPGKLIDKNNPVDLTVSLGEPPSSKSVPNLVGKSMGSAIRELEALGLTKEQILVKYRYQPNLVPNTVVSQSVATGTPLMDVETIELVISTDKIPGSN